MLYVVVEELIPEASEGAHRNIGTSGFAIGFALMMVLDVTLGERRGFTYRTKSLDLQGVRTCLFLTNVPFVL